jgi:FkbM family methyltransferase
MDKRMSEAAKHGIQLPAKRRSAGSLSRALWHAIQVKVLGRRDSVFRVPGIDLEVAVDATSLFARQLAKYRVYEPSLSQWVLDRCDHQAGGLFVDVGANFGWYSLLFAHCAGPSGTVVAIEPEPHNLALLRANLDRNRVRNVRIASHAVGEARSVGSLALMDPLNPGAHSLRPTDGPCQTVAIEIHPLDAVLEACPGAIDLLKLDIEGYEIDALRGARNTLQRAQCVMLEYSPRFLRACGRDPDELFALLAAAGLQPHQLAGRRLVPVARDELKQQERQTEPRRLWQADLIFTRP